MLVVAGLCAVLAAGVARVASSSTFVERGGPGAQRRTSSRSCRPRSAIPAAASPMLIVGSLEIIAMHRSSRADRRVGRHLPRTASAAESWRARCDFSATSSPACRRSPSALFAYTRLVVLPAHFSALSAAVALAVIMLPIVVRTTEEAVRLVPHRSAKARSRLESRRGKRCCWSRACARGPASSRDAACGRARRRRIRAAAVYRVRQSVLEPRHPTPDGRAAAVIFQYAISPYRDWQQPRGVARSC